MKRHFLLGPALIAIILASAFGPGEDAALAASSSETRNVGRAPIGVAQKRSHTMLAAPEITFTKFVLPNGLTVIHHEDRGSPTVTVQLWYKVGSRNEPKGKAGFAHLFEHLMFNGSENMNTGWYTSLKGLGATNVNGTTTEDRTNYYQTVPKGSLDAILWLESDRMGHFLGTVDQAKLDEQRSVVQNEKREAENKPLSMVSDRIRAATLSSDHPYSHSPIGSMEDLNAASLDDVRQWFRDWYGPNNAVLVLVGDLSLNEAKQKAEQYFAEIPAGGPTRQPIAWVQTLSTSQREMMQDRVPSVQINRVWNVPGYGSPDAEPLDAIARALAGTPGARLRKRLEEDEKLATKVRAFNSQMGIAGQFRITVTLKDGADQRLAERIIDEEIANLIVGGPSAVEIQADNVRRAKEMLDTLESVSAKSDLLAYGEIFEKDPGYWRHSFERAVNLTPGDIARAGRTWLSGGSYTLIVEPFPEYRVSEPTVDRKVRPPSISTATVPFPAFKTFRLTNGIEVVLAERHDMPKVTMQMSVAIGTDPEYLTRKQGARGLAISLLGEGTLKRSRAERTEELDRLGATVKVNNAVQFAEISASAMKPTLSQVVDIWADTIRNPKFTQADFIREKSNSDEELAQWATLPDAMAAYGLARGIFGLDHPDGRMLTRSALAQLNREDIVGFHKRWFGPNNARIAIAGDITEAELRPLLEKAFAGWEPAAGNPMPVAMPERPLTPMIYLLDSPGASQSIILAGKAAAPLNVRSAEAEELFNMLLGGSFSSRLNTNLRETKGWSYGASSGFEPGTGPRIFSIRAPVQTDSTGAAMSEIKKDITGLLGGTPPTAEEFEIVRDQLSLGMMGGWGGNDGVVFWLEKMARYSLPKDYLDSRAQAIRNTTIEEAVAAGNSLFPDDRLIWVVVGDLTKIEAEVRALKFGDVQVIDFEGRRLR